MKYSQIFSNSFSLKFWGDIASCLKFGKSLRDFLKTRISHESGMIIRNTNSGCGNRQRLTIFKVWNSGSQGSVNLNSAQRPVLYGLKGKLPPQEWPQLFKNWFRETLLLHIHRRRPPVEDLSVLDSEGQGATKEGKHQKLNFIDVISPEEGFLCSEAWFPQCRKSRACRPSWRSCRGTCTWTIGCSGMSQSRSTDNACIH